MLQRIGLATPRLPSKDWLTARLSKTAEVVALPTGLALDEWLGGATVDVVVVDFELLGEAPAAALAAITESHAGPAVAVLMGVESHSAAEAESIRAELIAAGAAGVFARSLDRKETADALDAIVARRARSSVHANAVAATDVGRLADFSSNSPAMKDLLRTARKVVGSDTTLLITGETGTGKEYLTEAIHHEGRRKDGPIVAVNCAAFAESLMETELFGHGPGAFTGAQGRRRGCFELAHGGTLFLDEIGEMPLHLQPKLLRALEDRSVRPVGDERAVDVDVRVVAATNRNLKSEVDAGRFRADLYYRLSVVTLELPPLRRRVEDIPSLARNHVEHFAAVLGRNVSGIDDEAIAALVAYPWPGNVREMINMIERAVLLSESTVLSPGDLPPEVAGGAGGSGAPASPEPGAALFGKPWREAREAWLHEFDRRYFASILDRAGGSAARAAELSGLAPRSFYDALKASGIDRKAFAKGQ